MKMCIKCNEEYFESQKFIANKLYYLWVTQTFQFQQRTYLWAMNGIDTHM